MPEAESEPEPIEPEPIEPEPIEQEPIEQEPIEQELLLPEPEKHDSAVEAAVDRTATECFEVAELVSRNVNRSLSVPVEVERAWVDGCCRSYGDRQDELSKRRCR